MRFGQRDGGFGFADARLGGSRYRPCSRAGAAFFQRLNAGVEIGYGVLRLLQFVGSRGLLFHQAIERNDGRRWASAAHC